MGKHRSKPRRPVPFDMSMPGGQAPSSGSANRVECRQDEAERMFRALLLDSKAGGELYLDRRVHALRQLIQEVFEVGKAAGLAEFVMADSEQAGVLEAAARSQEV
jgi:hypothetical protein